MQRAITALREVQGLQINEVLYRFAWFRPLPWLLCCRHKIWLSIK
jgi:hypothetical protein